MPPTKSPNRAHADVTCRRATEEGYDLGVHATVPLGTVEVGVSVDQQPDDAKAVGLFVDAPRVGKLVVALAVEPDGTARVASVMRQVDGELVAGPPAPTQEQLRLKAQLARERQRSASLEQQVAVASREALEQVVPELAAARAERDESKGKLKALETSLATLRKRAEALNEELQTLRAQSAQEAEALAAERARSAELKAMAERLANELGAERAARAESEARAAKLSSERDEARSKARAAQAALEAELATTAKLRAERSATGARAAELTQALEEERASGARLRAEQEQLEARLEELGARVGQLERELQAEKEISASRMEALSEEQRHREELLLDIAFIRNEVADLSTTKGSLLRRLDTMARREEKRQVAASEMTSLLRDAEVVASDRAASLRRMQARAEQLEGQLAEAKAEVASLRSELEEANRARQTFDALTAERDALKVQISYLQKQVGAMQRRQQPPRPTVAEPALAPAGPERVKTQLYGTGGSPEDETSRVPTLPASLDEHRSQTQPALPILDLPEEWTDEVTVPGARRIEELAAKERDQRPHPSRRRADDSEGDE